jgi:hypothetical protein
MPIFSRSEKSQFPLNVRVIYFRQWGQKKGFTEKLLFGLKSRENLDRNGVFLVELPWKALFALKKGAKKRWKHDFVQPFNGKKPILRANYKQLTFSQQKPQLGGEKKRGF